jgi:hypothetical protein
VSSASELVSDDEIRIPCLHLIPCGLLPASPCSYTAMMNITSRVHTILLWISLTVMISIAFCALHSLVFLLHFPSPCSPSARPADYWLCLMPSQVWFKSILHLLLFLLLRLLPLLVPILLPTHGLSAISDEVTIPRPMPSYLPSFPPAMFAKPAPQVVGRGRCPFGSGSLTPIRLSAPATANSLTDWSDKVPMS